MNNSASSHYFISYSSADGKDFSLKLADSLAAGPPSYAVWLDKRHLRPGEDWDEQIVKAIQGCRALIFVMTTDSVRANSVCKQEWVRALRYKKPIIPLLLKPEVELPFRLGSRNYIDFTLSFDQALAQLRKHLAWMNSPAGHLQALQDRLADAERELPRAQVEQQIRIREDIKNIEREINIQQEIINNPAAAQQRVQETIERGLERERKPEHHQRTRKQGKFINPPPLVAPTWFQNRFLETKMIGDFLQDGALRMMTIVGRGGIGKSALVCRLLHSLESGQLPDEGGPLAVEGIVYLSNARSIHRTNVPDIVAGLTKLLSESQQKRLETIYKNPHISTYETMQALAEAFSDRQAILLLDNFEDVVDVETNKLTDNELDEALKALLALPPHRLKLIITTRIAPRELILTQPGQQRRLDLDEGLEYPYAENVLRAMDSDGKLGLQDASEGVLAQARERTRGYPRALEHLFGILSADRDTSLPEILENTKKMLPEQVVEVLVGEAYNRLDLISQQLMQALAIYRYPVPAPALDYLLQPYVAGIDSGPILSRLVNMQFARRDAGRYYLHQIDRDYALNAIPLGTPADREVEKTPYTRFALQHQAAEWFRLTRKPREDWKTLEDLAPQLAEFELRFAGEDYDTAASVLLEIGDEYLAIWGHYKLNIELNEKIQGKVTDTALQLANIYDLGNSCYRIGQLEKANTLFESGLTLAQKTNHQFYESSFIGYIGMIHAENGKVDLAISYAERALMIVRKLGNRHGESVFLGNLSNRYTEKGQILRAIEYGEQELKIAREIQYEPTICISLNNLGNCYLKLNLLLKALEHYEGALKIAQKMKFRLLEAAAKNNLGRLNIIKSEWVKAKQAAQESIRIADEVSNIQVQNEARGTLALIHLYQGELDTGIEIAKSAKGFRYQLNDHAISVILGIAYLLRGNYSKTKDAFSTALAQTHELVLRNPNNFEALDSQGLAHCGLALCQNISHLTLAKEAFNKARTINSNIGITDQNLKLFDTLAKADHTGILTDIRLVVEGKQP